MDKLTLKAIRVNLNLTQEEVSKAVGISQRTLGLWENKKVSPNYKTLKKLLDFYNVPLSVVDL